MQEGNSIPTIKTLILDSNFEFDVNDNTLEVWKLKDGKTLEIKLSEQFNEILEFTIPYLEIDGYIDLREKNITVESELKRQFEFEIENYALEKDEQLTEKAIELKKKLLDLFERKKLSDA